MVLKHRKNEPKSKAGGVWGNLFNLGVLGGGSRLKKSVNEEVAGGSGSKQQNYFSFHDNAGGPSLTARLVTRRTRRVDQVDNFFNSPHWHKWLEAGHRSGCDDALMTQLRENEIKTLELIRPDYVNPSGRHVHALDTGLISGRHTSKRLQCAATSVGMSANAKCAAYTFAIKNLMTDGECERVCQQRRLNVWVLKLLITMHWPLSSYFIAVHAIEKTIRAEFPGTRFDCNQFHKIGPSIGVASLMLAITCECSQREFMRAKVLINDLTELNNINDVITKQLSIGASLRNGCLLVKTPADWLSYYIARLKLHNDEIERILGETDYYQRLFTEFVPFSDDIRGEMTTYCLVGKTMLLPHPCVMAVICEVALHTAFWHYVNNLHRKLEGSTLMAIVIWYILFEVPRVGRQMPCNPTVSTDMSMDDASPTLLAARCESGGGGAAKLDMCALDAISALIFNLPFRDLLADWIPLVPTILTSVQSCQWVEDFGPLKLNLQFGLARSYTSQ